MPVDVIQFIELCAVVISLQERELEAYASLSALQFLDAACRLLLQRNRLRLKFLFGFCLQLDFPSQVRHGTDEFASLDGPVRAEVDECKAVDVGIRQQDGNLFILGLTLVQRLGDGVLYAL